MTSQPVDTDRIYEGIPADVAFDAKGLEFLPADDLDELLDELTQRHHMTAAHFTVALLWKRTRTKKAIGKTTKTSGLLRVFAETDFIIWLAADHAREHMFTERQVEALLFHELLHIEADEDGKPATREHDAEVFRAELEVYGLWDDQLRVTFGQLELDLDSIPPTPLAIVVPTDEPPVEPFPLFPTDGGRS